jgi:hypothetical protein
MSITQRDGDLGTAYALTPSKVRTELIDVRRGSPMGELMRRYQTWRAVLRPRRVAPGWG